MTPAMVVLIPAYEPDEHLVALVTALRAAAPAARVLVVDDGSGPRYVPLFHAVAGLGATILTHPKNAGKGAALRTGLAHVESAWPGHDVVCADSDGQHLPTDILAVAQRLASRPTHEPGPIVLGARSFAGRVPFRSRFGNEATRGFVRIASGLRLRDTQTGLRGYPADLVGWLQTVPGDRFEYEMAVLLRAHADRRPIVEVPIRTVYLDGNSGTHFRPIVDSARVYAPLLRFVASSTLAAILDVIGLVALMALTGNLLVSVVGARAISATVNFTVNRQVVFGSSGPLGRAARRYATLAIALVAANYALMWTLTSAGAGLLLAKIVTETVLCLTSFAVQNRVVFRHKPPPTQPPREIDRYARARTRVG